MRNSEQEFGYSNHDELQKNAPEGFVLAMLPDHLVYSLMAEEKFSGMIQTIESTGTNNHWVYITEDLSKQIPVLLLANSTNVISGLRREIGKYSEEKSTLSSTTSTQLRTDSEEPQD